MFHISVAIQRLPQVLIFLSKHKLPSTVKNYKY